MIIGLLIYNTNLGNIKLNLVKKNVFAINPLHLIANKKI